MKIKRKLEEKLIVEPIDLPSSKSISNRLLIIQALANQSFELSNLSKADDTQILIEALNSNSSVIDVGMAGTAFRFLTSYYTLKNREVKLTGHPRMLERPIEPLVKVLNSLGANINYLEKENYPPLLIKRCSLISQAISIDSSISSQFISSILLIAPYLKNGLEIRLVNEVVSSPYINITIRLMERLGIEINWQGDIIKVSEGNYSSKSSIKVEADWSSAAFFYQYFTCSKLNTLKINGLAKNSIQGDSACVEIFENLGVKTRFNKNGIELHRSEIKNKTLSIDLNNTPDLIPSFAIAAAFVLDEVVISGVQTLRVKESNRVIALQNELAKINIELKDINSKKISLKKEAALPQSVKLNVYNDHRLAMCFAMLGDQMEVVEISDPLVVSKSFPNFWEEFQKLGLNLC